MGKLNTQYMGLDLKSPVIVGACDLVENPVILQKIEQAGAGAIVFKSLFEEQVQLEDIQLSDMLDSYNERNAEMIQVFPGTSFAGPEEFLQKLRKARQSLKIPLIGSLNAVHENSWVTYAKAMEETGIDGIELNFFNVPFASDKTGAEIEEQQLQIIRQVVAAIKIPVSVKLSPYYSNLLNFIPKVHQSGGRGIVLFNKLFQPDIDLDSLKHTSPWNLSHEKEYRLSLRYSGLLFGEGHGDIAASRGVMDAEDVVRLLLAGAQAVQVVSTLYRNGIERIAEINNGISAWMTGHSYASIDEFRGKLSRQNTANPIIYKRAQYIDMMLNSDKLIGRPLV